MNFWERGRNISFKLLDVLKHKPVANALGRLEKFCGENVEEQEIVAYQQQKMKELLQHVCKTTKYYEAYEGKDLEDFPVVDKNILKNRYEDFISSVFERESLFKMSTSGSTGTPFISLQNLNKKKSVHAEVLYYNGKTGYQVGRRIIYLRSIVGECEKSAKEQFMQNIYLLDCNDLSDDGIEEKLEFIKKYTKHSGAMMMGYASTLSAFKDYFERKGIEKAKGCHLYGIVSGSEMLYDDTREMMEKAFQCKCVSRYANEENGFLGQDNEQNNIFVTNRAHYYFEVLKMDVDEPVEDGEIGRIVITDLYNYAMPMIRYDTGDVGKLVLVQDNGKLKQAIGDFGGRKVDMVFDCNGNLISPHAITNAMWKFSELNQFQFIQNDIGNYTIKLNVDENFSRECELIQCIRNVVGAGAEVNVEYVEEIPVLASGKKRYIVNNMNFNKK